MLNPIKRVWVPPKKAEAPTTAPPEAPPQVAPKAATSRSIRLDDLPEPDVEEKNSDSVWAEFDSVFNAEEMPKKGLS